ncbi:hypothetical protein NFI96_022650 [Prochilodus magdalenae]|nr:hypothetical protein NFI96_022650 [Prochilodus magdalenae]
MRVRFPGRGLPAGLEEVEMIERARMKRAWEATLPPLNDPTQLEKRKRMMDEMERKEWAFREQEIERLQEARLALLMQLLRQREVQQEEATVERLDRRFSKQQRQKEARLQKIRSDYVLSLRKLTAKAKNVEGKLERRDIINDYSDYGSQTYAPLSRCGVFPDKDSERNVVRNRFLNTYQGLLELEASLPASVLEPRIKAPKRRESKGFIRRSARMEMELMRTHQALKDEKIQVEEKKPLRFLYKVEKPVPRPPTPVVDTPPEGEEEMDLAVIYLQKLLRGRSIQNQVFQFHCPTPVLVFLEKCLRLHVLQMLEGKEKRLELIAELRTTHALQRQEQELHRADKQVTQVLQRQQELQNSRRSQIESYVTGLSGAVLVDMLDFLAKELVRLQEERRVHAFTLLAERDRRLREAEESGRRQVEERRRREEDEIFKQVIVFPFTLTLKTTRTSPHVIPHFARAVAKLCSYQISTGDQGAVSLQTSYADKLAVFFSLVSCCRRNNAQSEEIVAELVYSFLIPEVHKITVRERVRQSQRKHLSAARSLIRSADDSSASSLAPGPRPPSPSTRASTGLLSQILNQVEETLATASAEAPQSSSDHHQEADHEGGSDPEGRRDTQPCSRD